FSIAYPSVITVSNQVGQITKVTATLVDLTHSFPAGLDVLLVGPHGQTVLLMSDVGEGVDVVRVTLKFDDAASSSLPEAGPIISGVYKPMNIGGGDIFKVPALVGPYGDRLSVFNGMDPNGDWKLFIMDDQGSDSGVIAGGWRLVVSTVSV